MNCILTVCVGNICRSPMAQALLAAQLPADLTVVSAGTGALVGHTADPIARELISAKGLSLDHHIARQIGRNDCQTADLILVMSRDQRQYLESVYPFARGKTFLLIENSGLGVPDPYGKGVDAFNDAFHLIEHGVDFWVSRIKKIIGKERQVI